VIERAGRTGEHYVTSSRREYWRMLGSAAGGGVITAGTAIGRFLIKWGQFPLFVDGALSSLLYAGSFLLIQFLGFTLATKQPSMTAAALAGTIRDQAGPDRLTDLVALIARISRVAVRGRGRQRRHRDRGHGAVRSALEAVDRAGRSSTPRPRTG
jgi:site-specific recombinase